MTPESKDIRMALLSQGIDASINMSRRTIRVQTYRDWWFAVTMYPSFTVVMPPMI